VVSYSLGRTAGGDRYKNKDKDKDKDKDKNKNKKIAGSHEQE
jgi:hypothetical protein